MNTTIDWAGKSRQPCLACDRGPKDASLSVTQRPDGRYIAFCHRCRAVSFSDDRKARTSNAPPPRAVTPLRYKTLSEFGHALWDACRPIAGNALAYLQARDCVLPPVDGDLRWHPALKHPPTGIVGPALVALVTDAVTREPMTLHRTWVNADGSKSLSPARMLLGGHRKSGGVIRLWPDAAVTMGLAIAEGIETALSMAHGYTPVWAVIDSGNMAAFPVLAGIESLVIAADNDPAGTRAADACARRWTLAGREVHVVMPDTEKSDLNDVLRAAA